MPKGLAQDKKITSDEKLALAVILSYNFFENKVSSIEIAYHLGIEDSTARAVLENLERRGLIKLDKRDKWIVSKLCKERLREKGFLCD